MAPNLGCKLGSPRELKSNQYLLPSPTFWFDWSGMQPEKWHFSGSPGDCNVQQLENHHFRRPPLHITYWEKTLWYPHHLPSLVIARITLLSFPDMIRDDSWDLVFIYVFIWLFVCQGTLPLLLCLVKPTGTMTAHSRHSKVTGWTHYFNELWVASLWIMA